MAQTNPYDILHFEEVALEGSIAVPDTSTAVLNVARREITPSPLRNVTCELIPTDEEVYFAIDCFHDLNQLRDFLRDLCGVCNNKQGDRSRPPRSPNSIPTTKIASVLPPEVPFSGKNPETLNNRRT